MAFIKTQKIVLDDSGKLAGKDKGISLPSLFGKASSQMCCRRPDGNVLIETPNRQTREIYDMIGLKAPATLKLAAYKAKIGVEV